MYPCSVLLLMYSDDSDCGILLLTHLFQLGPLGVFLSVVFLW